MPDSPAHHTVVLTKAEYGATTERMATPEELLALQLLAQEEEAVIQAIESAAQLPESKPATILEPAKDTAPESIKPATFESRSAEEAVPEPKATSIGEQV